jgi:hypothetical protein
MKNPDEDKEPRDGETKPPNQEPRVTTTSSADHNKKHHKRPVLT